MDALRSGDPREAIRRLEPLTRHPHAPGEAHYHLALALRLHGDLRGAIATMRRAVARLPGSAAPQTQLGALLQLAGDGDGAVACYRTAVAVDPGHGVSWYHLAIALVQTGERAEGEASLHRALALGLPLLLDERAKAQLAELRWPGENKPPTLCSAPMYTELLDPPGATSPARRREEAVGEPRIVALTGAGISAGSGLATRKELWQRYPRDEAVSIWKFHENPAMLWGVVSDFLGSGGQEANEAHRALARLPGLRGIITQNVDGLHQRAHREVHGEEAPYPIVEFHGTLGRTMCHGCGQGTGKSSQQQLGGALPPRCEACGGVVRPDVVLFGEPVGPPVQRAALELVRSCEVLLVVGCAMDVAPASELPRVARGHGARVIEFKRTPSRLGRTLDTLLWPGSAVSSLPELERALTRG
ncbi:MAG: tetratricopeptide repeat protein [Polyangiaceae bacterium]|nr:tetratricopeptide repeat protein [Polyangiaceae bacterium]